MKFFKYLLLLLLLLVLLFFVKGLLTPTIEYSCQVNVNKSAKEAWAVMSDESNLPKWIKGFKRTELISGTANTKGAISNVYVEENGQEMMMQETINEIRPYEKLHMTFAMDFMDMDYIISFNEVDGKTDISSKSVTSGNGMIAKSIVSFMPKAMKEQEQENLNSLKKLIETNTKNYFPEPEPVIEQE